MKEDRKLYLLSGSDVLKSYKVHLGFDPLGHKAIEGDGRTPEGNYLIDDSGKRYLDACGGAAVSCLGHDNAAVRAALAAIQPERA